MNVRDFVIKVTFVENLSGKIAWFNFVSGDGGFCASVDEVERAASAYAAKAAPAPVSTAWKPKRDEVVLVEMEFIREKADGEAYVQKGDGNFIAVPRSAIVGPAPKREPGPKFSFGQDALYVPAMEKVIVNHFIGFGKYDVYRMGHESFTAHEDDLLTMDEARERLSK